MHRSRSPNPERYDKFASLRNNQSAKSRSHPRKPESLQIQSTKETRKTTQTATNDDKATNDLPASPQLSIVFSNNLFSSTFDNREHTFGHSDVVNLFTKLDLETSTASSNLEGIMNLCSFFQRSDSKLSPITFQSNPDVTLSSNLTY